LSADVKTPVAAERFVVLCCSSPDISFARFSDGAEFRRAVPDVNPDPDTAECGAAVFTGQSR